MKVKMIMEKSDYNRRLILITVIKLSNEKTIEHLN